VAPAVRTLSCKVTSYGLSHAACSIAHSIICTRLFRGKMHSDWFNGIEILHGRWQHGEKVGYCYPSGLERTVCKWDMYVPLVTKGLRTNSSLKTCAGKYVKLWSDTKPASEDVCYVVGRRQTARPSSDNNNGANTCSAV